MVAPLLVGSILDLGSGYGGLTSLLKQDQIYLGVDSNPELIELLRTKRHGFRFRCLNLDTDRLDLGEKFDTIVLLAVLEHLKQPAHLFSQLHDCLNPGGSIVLTTPTPWGNLIHSIGARFGLFSLESAKDHVNIYTQKKLQRLGLETGFSIRTYRKFLGGGNQLCVFAPPLHPSGQEQTAP